MYKKKVVLEDFMLTYDEFLKQFIKDLTLEFDLAAPNGDFIRIYQGGIVRDIDFDLLSLHRNYQLSNNYSEMRDNEIERIHGLLISHSIFKLDLNKIYPMIKPKSFTKNHGKTFLHKNLFLDLDVYYVQDCDDVWLYLSKDTLNDYDLSHIHKNAITNISKVPISLNEIDGSGVYAFDTENVYGVSLFLSNKVQLDIMATFGDELLLIIPNSSSILLTPYSQEHVEILKSIVKDDIYNKSEDKISNRVYHYHNESFKYADVDLF